jgi:hypothetical protein
MAMQPTPRERYLAAKAPKLPPNLSQNMGNWVIDGEYQGNAGAQPPPNFATNFAPHQPPQGPPQWAPMQGPPQRGLIQGLPEEAPMQDQPQYNVPDTAAMEVPEEEWSAKGKTDSFGAFFNKRQGTDALTAFGAAMLKAPNFHTGLADAALAVNQVDRENRMPSPEEIARANIKYKMANGQSLKGASVKQTYPGYDGNGNYVTQVVMSDGSSKYLGQDNQELVGGVNGFRRAQDSGEGQRGKDNEKYLTISRDRAEVAQGNMATYDTLLETGTTSNAGSGVFESGLRSLASIAGVDLGEGSLSDQQVFTKASRQLELQVAQSQKGLGQFTEMERTIVKEAIPNLNTQQETIFRVAVQMKLRDQLDVELYNDYMDQPPNQRGSFEEFAYAKRKEQKADYKRRYAEMVSQELDLHPQYKNLSGKATAASVLDEADAIVNGP